MVIRFIGLYAGRTYFEVSFQKPFTKDRINNKDEVKLTFMPLNYWNCLLQISRMSGRVKSIIEVVNFDTEKSITDTGQISKMNYITMFNNTFSCLKCP